MVFQYLTKAEERLKEEEDRVEMYVHWSVKKGELKGYVDALLEVHWRNQEVVSRSFKGEAGFASNKVSEEADLEQALNEAMILFKYLEDQEVFQTFYSSRLSNRLIHSSFEYTNKERNHGKVESILHILVLDTDFWQIQAPKIDFKIPSDILHTAALLRYNDHDSLTIDELWKVPLRDEKRGMTTTRVRDCEDKKIRTNLNMSIKTNKQDASEVLGIVEDERKFVIQATIDRVMKLFKTMKAQANDTLLEKEYIERADGTRDTFIDVA
ncbi:hypothetical protein CALVIDRAFT_531870 [Calocera viscosa TUFC12733]|uniref:Cullin family profile domain-containing protein n=1 Tax=Calocera viscosa (strain TUFC12733) TaxID=1330018 RepID=A0A167FRG0_CALVF|nr:hypothetical protein CALVIDRAFT_531870 [Calocera viscosa TUFC12733]